MVLISNTTKQKVKLAPLQNLAEEFLRVYKKSQREVSIVLLGAVAMRRLNRESRGIDRATDVLSFGAPAKWPKNLTAQSLGEVIINLDEIKKTELYQDLFAEPKTPAYILQFILVHGLLHLAGYDDRTASERRVMLKLGKRFLERRERVRRRKELFVV